MKQRLWRGFDRLVRWRHLALVLILIITLLAHFSIILIPKDQMFDEQFYVTDANLIIKTQTSERLEHPPLAKLLVVAGIELFGNNQFGWRFFSVIFGAISIALVYFICRRLKLSEMATLLVTFLFAFENLSFVQASVAMLDVYSLTLGLAAFLLYLHDQYELSGLMVALSGLAKLNGLLVLPVIGLHWLLVRRTHIFRAVCSVVIAGGAFLAFLGIFQYVIFHEWRNPVKDLMFMEQQTGSITFSWVTHPSASQPWVWLYLPQKVIIPYWYNPNYSGALSWTLWPFIVPATLYMGWRALWKRDTASTFGMAWVLGTYFIWIPVVLVTDRVTYPYYLYSCVGGLCIGMAQGFGQLTAWARDRGWRKRGWLFTGIMVAYCVGHIAVLLIMSPIVNRPWL